MKQTYQHHNAIPIGHLPRVDIWVDTFDQYRYNRQWPLIINLRLNLKIIKNLTSLDIDSFALGWPHFPLHVHLCFLSHVSLYFSVVSQVVQVSWLLQSKYCPSGQVASHFVPSILFFPSCWMKHLRRIH